MPKIFTYNGETLTVTQWAGVYEMNPNTLSNRLFIQKWDIEKALLTPISINRRLVRPAIEMYHFVMRRFFTKEKRLESYKRVMLEMKEQRMKKAASYRAKKLSA